MHRSGYNYKYRRDAIIIDKQFFEEITNKKIIGDILGRNVLENAKADWNGTKLMAVVGTLIVLLVCLGIMYLRFRVFGG